MVKPILPRIHSFEFHDLKSFPNFLKYQITFILYIYWSFELPQIITDYFPMLKHLVRSRYQVVSQALSDAIVALALKFPNDRVSVMDMCSGGSGPNDLISKQVNHLILDMCSGGSGPNTLISTHVNTLMEVRGSPNIQFYLTDLYPNLETWKRVCSTNPYLNYIGTPVDITQPFTNLPKFDKIFQTFYCCFHHFDDTEIRKILKNSLSNSDGFAILETTSRTPFNVLKVSIINTLFTLFIIPFYITKIPLTMLITLYIIPILLLTFLWDNVISSLRTRSSEEILDIINELNLKYEEGDDFKWEFVVGGGYSTYPTDRVNWLIGLKKPIDSY
ncbi:hypothetical protein CONCODRAFT_61361 [Conidiobolus coronatus NRRL 28638]|uniref:Methyltransferase domain-containing protein n=1 Tax=Conidiobolus coronatus (strain ATCC 28846 / CBS 209.66 / NRRL 28638) TaxID=796925 RepID=A0A137NWD0_CONC2|nr:hypothetical protein CONCODRAFT_61361 [Conidiobolus coronatus NRRL 28638]|eukprot:KXN66998.1 hypothetical protein CONCODRAFT_61361 [Conidiobolus coronatus NRRL 28638]